MFVLFENDKATNGQLKPFASRKDCDVKEKFHDMKKGEWRVLSETPTSLLEICRVSIDDEKET